MRVSLTLNFPFVADSTPTGLVEELHLGPHNVRGDDVIGSRIFARLYRGSQWRAVRNISVACDGRK